MRTGLPPLGPGSEIARRLWQILSGEQLVAVGDYQEPNEQLDVAAAVIAHLVTRFQLKIQVVSTQWAMLEELVDTIDEMVDVGHHKAPLNGRTAGSSGGTFAQTLANVRVSQAYDDFHPDHFDLIVVLAAAEMTADQFVAYLGSSNQVLTFGSNRISDGVSLAPATHSIPLDVAFAGGIE